MFLGTQIQIVCCMVATIFLPAAAAAMAGADQARCSRGSGRPVTQPPADLSLSRRQRSAYSEAMNSCLVGLPSWTWSLSEEEPLVLRLVRGVHGPAPDAAAGCSSSPMMCGWKQVGRSRGRNGMAAPARLAPRR